MNTLLPQATQDLIQEYLEALPQYMQDTLLRLDWTAELARIGAKHRLGQEQITNLTVETAMTLFGISEPELFYNNIINHTGVSGEIAESITRDVAGRIFERIQQMIHDEYGDQIMALQDELVQVEAEEDSGNEVLKRIGIDVTSDESNQKVTEKGRGVSWDGIIDSPASSLVEKKILGTFSLDSNVPRAVHYPDADPYHEDLMIDVASEPIRQKPPTPPMAPKNIQSEVTPNMIVPPMPPAPPVPKK